MNVECANWHDNVELHTNMFCFVSLSPGLKLWNKIWFSQQDPAGLLHTLLLSGLCFSQIMLSK